MTAALLRIMTILITNYCKIITNYNKKLLQITAVLLHITAAGCYKLWQLYYKLRQKIITNYDKKLLQITTALIFEKFKIITNYVKIYYMLRQFLVLLQIKANFITNYGRYYKLRRYYKLHCNSKNRVFYGLELNLENRVLHLKNNIQRFTSLSYLSSLGQKLIVFIRNRKIFQNFEGARDFIKLRIKEICD